MLRHRDFRRFYASYTTSLLGSAMSGVAVTFAVLGGGGSAAGLGCVLAAGVIPQVLFMLGGGVLADRLGRRKVMLGADAARLTAQGILAAELLLAAPPIWLIVVLSAVLGTGEAFFAPALGGLTQAIAPRDRLADANALLGVAQSATKVIGPALAGVLIGVSQPGVVIAVDAATFCVSLLSLALLRVPAIRPGPRSPWQDLADGWRQFRAQTWPCVITVQFALFNLLTWAPYLLLGPLLARAYLGGASAWGTIMAAMALGSVRPCRRCRPRPDAGIRCGLHSAEQHRSAEPAVDQVHQAGQASRRGWRLGWPHADRADDACLRRGDRHLALPGPL